MIGETADGGLETGAEPMSDRMTPELWDKVQDLLLGALEVSEHDRATFLSRACDGDIGLLQEVQSLLDAHSTPGPVDRLADTLGARVLSEFIEGGGLEGETVDHYEVGERLGRGGMSVVFRAWDSKLERDVALKLLPALLSSDESSRERLLVEARVAAGLEHPNICTIHEIGAAEDGRLFITMPFYEGETVQAKLEAGPLAEEETIGLALQMARGLATAHQHGVVHRDIKPGNLMITDGGTLKILDFGIAQLEGASDTMGQTAGTIHYMSPEQVEGQQVDARTDLWSLGVVLYEMLAGRRPFDGETRVEVGRAIVEQEPVALKRARPEISPGTDALVRALLHKDPSRRPRTAVDVAKTLLSLQRDLSAEPEGAAGETPLAEREEEGEVPGSVTRRLAAAVGWLGLAAAISAGVWYSRGDNAPGRGAGEDAAGQTTSISSAEVDAPPTDNAVALEYYVRGKALLRDPMSAPGASGNAEWMFRQAVQLDPTFALAWAALAQWHSGAVSGVDAPVTAIHRRPTPSGSGQLTAAVALEEATTYGPDLPETIKARGWYAFNVERDDDSAFRHFEEALRAQPDDPDILLAMALIRINQGQWETGLPYLERAQRMDPGASWRAVLLGQMYSHVRRYDEAERLYDTALAKAPTNAEAHIGKAIVRLQRDGDVSGAIQVLEDAGRLANRADLITRFIQPAGRYPFIRILAGSFRGWLSDPAVARDVRSRCQACYWHVQAQTAEQGDEPEVARVYYDSAFASLLPDPDSPPRSFWYGALWAAGLGRNEEAIRYANSAVARGPMLSSDAISGYHHLLVMTEVYARTGEFEDAISALEQLLSHPGQLSGPVLALDPLWAPLRGHPDFQRLLAEYR